ncbi:MAG: pyridoxamine 5'-phosphate oxidase family protein [Marmoricola sp.]
MEAPAQWADTGFHSGELAVQQRAAVAHDAARLSAMLAPADLSGGLTRFLAERTFLVITGRDGSGRLWTSPLIGPPGFLQVRSATRIAVLAAPPLGDPLHGLPTPQKVGLTAIEFSLRRRVRLNGALGRAEEDLLVVEVDQAFGNCPQYIQRRLLGPRPETGDGLAARPDVRRGEVLLDEDVDLIRGADTFFLGTTAPGRGSDASHRGGAPGFVRVDDTGLWWPDYHGNNLFNSLGNLEVSSEAALLFVDFAAGRALHVSGRAEVEWGRPGRTGDDDRTGRIVRLHPEEAVAAPLPVRESEHQPYPRNPRISRPRTDRIT